MPDFFIKSLEDARLDVYRSLKKTNQTRYHEVFIAEGVTVVERLFQSDYEVQSVLITEAKLETFRKKIPDGVAVYAVPRELATELVGYTFHRGVLAAGVRKASPALHSVLPESRSSFVMLADRVIDQQNIGLLIRVAAGFGADAMLVTKGSADPFSRRAVRVSMGNGLFMPIVELPEPTEDSIRTLQRVGYSCCAAVLSEQAEELSSFPFSKRTAIVFGNETHGVSDSIMQLSDHQLKIAMLNGTDSLNVAIAAGVFGYAYRAAYPASLANEPNESS